MPTVCISSSATCRARRRPYAEPDERPFGDLLADAHHRVERGHRLLEDHRDLAAPNLAEPSGEAVARSVPSNRISPPASARGAGQQPDERPERHRLARARLSDDPERLAPADRERRAVDCAQDAARELELDLEAADFEQGVAHSGRNRSASPSAISERPSAVITIAMPGIVESSQCVVRYVWPSEIIRPQSGVGGCTPRPR